MAEGGSLDKLRDWGSKLAGAALRIAGIFCAARVEHLAGKIHEIQCGEVERATALCAALIPHAVAVFNLVNEDPQVTLAKSILRWLRKQGKLSLTRRECFRALHRQFDQVADMEAPLRVLIDHFYIRMDTAKTGGRSSEVIEINPRWNRNEDLA